jgi:hypothetical protein
VPPIRAAFGQARKYNLRCLPVLQNWGQLVDIYGQQGAWTFIGNSDCVAAFNPGHDLDTARFFSDLCGDRAVISKSASPDPLTGVRENVSEGHDRVWSVDRVRQLPEFHGLVWRKNRPVQPVYFEPYMDNPAQKRVAREDPYHRNTGGGTTAAAPSARVGFWLSFGILALLALSIMGWM